MRRPNLTLLPIVIAGLALVLAVASVLAGRVQGQSNPTPTPTPSNRTRNKPPTTPDPSGLAPTPIAVIDLATQTPIAYKDTVYVQLADGSREAYLVASDQVTNFVNQLPAGEHAVADAPPQILMGKYAIATVSPGIVTFPNASPTLDPPATPTFR